MNIDTIAESLMSKRAQAMQEWGSKWLPYWDTLTPEEQEAKWESHLLDFYGPDKAVIACDYCHDFGFVHPLKTNKKPDYSRVISCPQCYVWTDEERTRRLIAAGIPQRRQAETFDTFKSVKGVDAAYITCWELATGGAEYSIVLLYGVHGNGKTHLARAALAQWLIDHRGESVQFLRVRDWFVRLKAMMTEDKTDVEIERVKVVGFLVIDEIGTEDTRSDWQAGTLEHVINYRYDEGLPTVLTYNGDVKGLPPAILSRLRDKAVCRIVLNEAVDYRPRLKEAT